MFDPMAATQKSLKIPSRKICIDIPIGVVNGVPPGEWLEVPCAVIVFWSKFQETGIELRVG